MEAVQHDAFWSYAHEDNDRSYGRVLKLSEAVRNEYALTSGDELELFHDRKDLKWGDTWRERIDEAIGEVPFFIAVVTPKYVRSAECRKELIAFSGHAKSRGLDKLLLPILYIDIPDLSEDSQDEMVALIARTQYLDWRGLRNKKLDSEEHLDAVNALAQELISRRQEISVISLQREQLTEAETLSDLKQAASMIDEKLEAWMESVDFDKMAAAQWAAARDVRLSRIDRLNSTHSGRGAVVATLFQLGQELLPIAQNRLEKAQSYAKLTIELDPLVDKALRLAKTHTDETHLLNSLRDGVNEAYLNIDPEGTEGGGNDYGLPRGIVQFNKHLEETDEVMQHSMIYVGEANELVLRWRERLRELDGIPIIQVR